MSAPRWRGGRRHLGGLAPNTAPRTTRIDSTAVSSPVQCPRVNKNGRISFSVERRRADPEARRIFAQYVQTALRDIHRHPYSQPLSGGSATATDSSTTWYDCLADLPHRTPVGDWTDRATVHQGGLMLTECSSMEFGETRCSLVQFAADEEISKGPHRGPCGRQGAGAH
jgi:hypothetical protein